MGKPPTRAIEARRLNITDELKANIRHRYEHTDEPLSTMAADLGCTAQTVCNLAKRENWARYVAPPRDLPPAARLLARAEKLACSSSPPLIAAQAETTPEPLQVADTAGQLHHELQGLLAEVRAERARMKREGYGKNDLQKTSQMIASLTATLRTLQPMLHAVPTSTEPETAYDDMPADLDEFRDALARRIEAFFASRPDAGDGGEPAAGDAAAPRP